MSQSSLPLHQAIWKSDEHTVINHLKKEKDWNAKDENGLRPLNIAVMTSNDKIVKLLLADKTKNVVIDSKTWSYLSSIVNEKVVSYLVEHHDGGSIKNCKDDNGQTPLHHAVINRNPRFIVLYCALGCKVNDCTKNGFTALHFAAIGNDVKSVEILLTEGAVSDMKTTSGKTPLYFAVKHGHKESVSLLIKEIGTANNMVDSFGSSSIHIAVENNDEGMVEFLLQHNADIMCKNNDGKNLLHIAAEYGYNKWITHFLEKGIDINSVTNDNSTPLLIALKNNKEDAAIILLNHRTNVNITDENGLSPLCLALQQKYIELSKKLVRNGANVNNLTLENSSVLHFAIQFCDTNMVKYLQQHGARLNVIDNLGQKEIHIAAKHNNSDMVRYLLESGMDVNERTVDKSTALHYAVSPELCYSNNVTVLLEYDIKVDAENESGDTALNIVCRHKNYFDIKCRIVEDLLRSHANPNHLGSDNQTPLSSCITNRNTSTAFLLAERGACCDKTNPLGDSVIQLLIKLNCGCPCKRGLLIKKFLDLGANINNVNEDGETPLHTSLIHEKGESVQEFKSFIDLGASITSNKFGESVLHLALKNKSAAVEKILEFYVEKDLPWHGVTANKHTIIHYAVQYNEDLEVLKILLDKINKDRHLDSIFVGRLINQKDTEGKTPLHTAASTGANSLIKVLLEHNANINSKDNDNNSPINYAIIEKHIETVKLLLKSGASTTDKNNDGFNAYDLAKQKDCHIYQLLLSHYV